MKRLVPTAPAGPFNQSDETTFRDLVHQLAEATELNDLAARAVRLASAIPSCGAYIERVRSATEIEVIAAVGVVAPLLGTVAAYPGSLTEELIQRGAPSVVEDLSTLGEASAPYLVPVCQGCAGLIVPLLAKRAALGCLVLLRPRPVAAFTREETERAITIGDLTSIGFQRVLTLENERQAREQLTTTLEAITDGFFSVDAEWRTIFANRQARQVAEAQLGGSAEDIIGRSIWDTVPQAVGTVFEREYRLAMTTQMPRHFEAYFEPWDRWFDVSAYPTPSQLSVYFRDVSAQKRAADAAQRLQRVQTILAETARLLESSLSVQGRLERVARLLVDWLCDWCVVYFAIDHGARRVVLAAKDPDAEATLRESIGDLVTLSESPILIAMRTGEARLMAEVSSADLDRAGTGSPAFQHALRVYTPRSVIVVPLIAQGRTIAVIGLVSTTAERRFDAQDLEVAEEVASRVAPAVDNARLFEEVSQRAASESALRRAISAVSVRMSVDNVLEEIARAATIALDTSAAFVERIDDTKTRATVVAVAGERAPDVGAWTPYDGSFAQHVIDDGKPQIVPDLGVANRPLPRVLATTCVGCPGLVAPLRGEDAVGALFFIRPSGAPPFTVADVARASDFAQLAGITFRKAHLLELAEHRRVQAETAVRSRDDMLAVVSHDLRNPLHTIVMSSSLLDERDVVPQEEERRKHLGIIKRSAERMNRLIQDLLDVGRIESGHFAIKCTCEHPAAIATDACEAVRPIAAEQRQRLRCEQFGELPAVNADRDRVVQVLTNFLDNAIKFSPKGAQIDFSVGPDPERPGVRFSVRDHGPGISAEKLPHVFERFWQDRSTAHRGAGLGLAIAKAIAEAHRGRVWAESAIGQGSTFTLWLPDAPNCDAVADE